jgi:periplasmic protein TonB
MLAHVRAERMLVVGLSGVLHIAAFAAVQTLAPYGVSRSREPILAELVLPEPPPAAAPVEAPPRSKPTEPSRPRVETPRPKIVTSKPEAPRDTEPVRSKVEPPTPAVPNVETEPPPASPTASRPSIEPARQPEAMPGAAPASQGSGSESATTGAGSPARGVPSLASSGVGPPGPGAFASAPASSKQGAGPRGAPDALASLPGDAGVTRTARPQGRYQVRPPYPSSARLLRVQGTTMLRVHVMADGRVGEVDVEQSAGHPDLDGAAREAVRRWRFEPARRGEVPVAMWVRLPFEFRLQ